MPSAAPFLPPEDTTAIVPNKMVATSGNRGMSQSGKFVIDYPFMFE